MTRIERAVAWLFGRAVAVIFIVAICVAVPAGVILGAFRQLARGLTRE